VFDKESRTTPKSIIATMRKQKKKRLAAKGGTVKEFLAHVLA
jgi:hypothetical protein